jgi:hypothetical protein
MRHPSCDGCRLFPDKKKTCIFFMQVSYYDQFIAEILLLLVNRRVFLKNASFK